MKWFISKDVLFCWLVCIFILDLLGGVKITGKTVIVMMVLGKWDIYLFIYIFIYLCKLLKSLQGHDYITFDHNLYIDCCMVWVHMIFMRMNNEGEIYVSFVFGRNNKKCAHSVTGHRESIKRKAVN